MANGWVKQGILLGFRVGALADVSMDHGRWPFFDKDTLPLKKLDVAAGVRIVPGGSTVRDGAFIADSVLAKHDETYMPKEVADKMGQAHRKHDVDAPAADAAAPLREGAGDLRAHARHAGRPRDVRRPDRLRHRCGEGRSTNHGLLRFPQLHARHHAGSICSPRLQEHQDAKLEYRDHPEQSASDF